MFLPSRNARGNAVRHGVVRRRLDRVVVNLPVELIAEGKAHSAVSQDASPLGMFIRLSAPLPPGTRVQIVVWANGQRYVTTGQVRHSLPEGEAQALGQFPGVGVTFGDSAHPADPSFLGTISRLLERYTLARVPNDLRIVIADAQTRLLERLSTALGSAGFIVATATNGMEAIGACLSSAPNVALIEREMPVVDGLHVLQEMGRYPQLASVPVIMMSPHASDLVRVQALQLGAVDFIPKPFTVLEVVLRARRWARVNQRDAGRVMLRGSLNDIQLPTLLQMFEQDKKTGQLAVTRDQLVAWLDFVDGKLVRARSSEADRDPRVVVFNVLSWKHGYFELSGGPPESGHSEFDTSITQLLLEHAQQADEASRHFHRTVC